MPTYSANLCKLEEKKSFIKATSTKYNKSVDNEWYVVLTYCCSSIQNIKW